MVLWLEVINMVFGWTQVIWVTTIAIESNTLVCLIKVLLACTVLSEFIPQRLKAKKGSVAWSYDLNVTFSVVWQYCSYNQVSHACQCLKLPNLLEMHFSRSISMVICGKKWNFTWEPKTNSARYGPIQRLLHLYLDDDVSKISKFPLSHQSDFQTLITQKWHNISISFFDILKI